MCSRQDATYHFVRVDVILAHDPAEYYHKGQHQQRNLHAGPHSNTNRQVHLVFDSDGHSGGVLCRITDNGQQY